jgi:copper oxidase (laccase) domain-containing protein
MLPELIRFPALQAHAADISHGFISRAPGVDVNMDRDAAVASLVQLHGQLVASAGFLADRLYTAKQVHGADVAVVTEGSPLVTQNADGLITNVPGIALGIYVADCGAVFLADPVKKAVGMLHSGKKGSEQHITARAIAAMREAFGTNPSDLILQLGPCIRPPAYEVDFASQILQDAAEAGVPPQSIHDCGLCTHSDADRFYSYRRELGKTGRLMGFIGLRNEGSGKQTESPMR